MKQTIAAVVFLFVSASLALECRGPADIVVAVPGSELVPDSEFAYIEDFLLNMTRYFDFPQTQIGLVLYGNETEVVSGLKSKLNAFDTNTRITLLSHRHTYDDVISGELDIASAIKTVHRQLKTEGRDVATKIGVILTYGGLSHVSSDNDTDDSTVEDILSSASQAVSDGVVLYAAAVNGSIPYFRNITQDTCKLFSLGNMKNLGDMVPYLASSMCYEINGTIQASQPDNCFPEVKEVPKAQEFTSCPAEGIDYLPDPTNCGYWYYCVAGRPFKHACPEGTLFDASMKRCNFKDKVACFTTIRCPEPNGMFSHPTDCSKFLNCYDNVPNVMSCAAGTLFNAEMGYCDYESNVQCPVMTV